MEAIFNHTMVIFNKDKEVKIPITEDQFNMFMNFIKPATHMKGYIFPDEDILVETLDNAIKTKLY